LVALLEKINAVAIAASVAGVFFAPLLAAPLLGGAAAQPPATACTDFE
jgi:hypothetical protein